MQVIENVEQIVCVVGVVSSIDIPPYNGTTTYPRAHSVRRPTTVTTGRGSVGDSRSWLW